MSNAPTFGDWLRHQRQERGVTQDELAEQLGFSVAMLRKLEAGERRPSGPSAELLADYFRIPADEWAAFVAFARTGPHRALPAAALPPTGNLPLAPWRRTYRHQSNLPARLTPLIGRSQESLAVRALLLQPKTRLLTLTGGPGIGKTRLAVQVAVELVDHFPDGVFLVDLAPVSDPDLVLATVARTLGLTEAGSRPLVEVLLDYVAERRMLLLLDNFEQILDAAGAVVQLLEASPWLKVLVTSRAALHVRGERRLPVPPLDLPDLQRLPGVAELAAYPAVALFVERAQAVAADFTLTAENAAAVAAVCVGLEGLPLAIELAAARVRHQTPAALQQALSSHLTLLTGGARDLPTRHRTLRGAIAWSYELLDAGEQRLLRQMGVFVGGFTAAALVGIGSPGPEAAAARGETLRSLVDKHLVQEDRRITPPEVSTEARFGLMEAVREFALEQLAQQAETAEVRRRHAAYYLAQAEQAEAQFRSPPYPGWGAEGLRWIDRLEADLDNMRGALAWYLEQAEAETATQAAGGVPGAAWGTIQQGLRLALGLRRVWFVRGYFTEGRQWLMTFAAAVPQPLPPALPGLRETYALVLAVVGRLSLVQGDLGSIPVRVLLEESVRLLREGPDQPLLTIPLLILGEVAAVEENYEAARRYLHECLQRNRVAGNRWGAAAALEALGNTDLQQGQFGPARPLLEESLALYRAVDDPFGAGAVLESLGRLAYGQGDYPAAQAWWEGSLQLRQAVRDRTRVGHSRVLLGWATLRQKNDPAAQAAFCEGLLLARELGAVRTMHWGLVGLGAWATTQQAPAHAARLLGAAAALQAAHTIRLSPAQQTEVAAAIAAGQAQLADAAWQTAWQAGQAMTLAQAVTYATAT